MCGPLSRAVRSGLRPWDSSLGLSAPLLASPVRASRGAPQSSTRRYWTTPGRLAPPLIATLAALWMSCAAGARPLAIPEGISRQCDYAARSYRDAVRLGQVPEQATLDRLYLCVRHEAVKAACFDADRERLRAWGLDPAVCRTEAP